MKVLTVGTFDLLHSGHIRLIKNCVKIAGGMGKVVIGVNTDEFVESYKGQKPIMPFKDRVEVISNLLRVDKVIGNDSPSLEGMLKDEQPNVLVVGSDWAKKDYLNQIGVSLDWLYENDILLLYTHYTPGVSTTNIKKGM